MASRVNYQQNDYDGDSTNLGFAIDEVTSANIVQLSTDFGTLRTAIEAVCLGESIRSTMSIESQFASDKTKATDANAKRGNKWLVSLEDTQQFLDPPTNSIPNPNYRETFQFTIGCANLSLRTQNSDIVYSSANPADYPAQFQTLATAIETIARSKFGTTGEVVEIRAVTVNLS